MEASPLNLEEQKVNDQVENKTSPKNNFLNIDTSKYKKQKTLSAKRRKEGSKSKIDKSSIKKSETRTSKWSQYVKSTQKGGNRSPVHSKTIERKFTLSSSISSIQCLSKNRAEGSKLRAKISPLKKQPTQNLSSFSRKSMTKKERFNALKLNVPHYKKPGARSMFRIKAKPTKQKQKTGSFNSEIDPSLERSLEKARQFDPISKREILASR